jgi:hypothetical protein
MQQNTKTKEAFAYSRFAEINGDHPLKSSAPGSFIEYQVRSRKKAKLFYFNYALAKEMGLIEENHPESMNASLEKTLLHTFSLVIINEYDQLHQIKVPQEDIRTNKYMATRYLQIQHDNKLGLTSGDGRSIWNGFFEGKDSCWDLSSCGTGATVLSPAFSKSKKYIKTGDPSVSYGCGYSDLDEGLAALVLSEVFARNSIETERVLCILEFPGNLAITVRAAKNLIRPSHLFGYVKQGDYDQLKKIVDYYVWRQEKNNFSLKKMGYLSSAKKYQKFLATQVEIFAQMAARLEDEYIFCWLDWDGDNILMNGGIIDYGSVRQFGLFHHEYRYDDVDRYSTTIVEQKAKAKYIVQTFVQITDFLINKKKKPITDYAKDPMLDEFERIFEEKKIEHLLYKLGLPSKYFEYLTKKHLKSVEDFQKDFSYFERTKSKRGVHEVPDGINWNAIFCMRDILREFPQIYLSREGFLNPTEFIDIIRSNYATPSDLELTPYRIQKIQSFQENYLALMKVVADKAEVPLDNLLLEVHKRSSIINKYDRITGDSVTLIVSEIMKNKNKFLADQLYKLLQHFSQYQNFRADDTSVDRAVKKVTKPFHLGKILEIVRDYREGL